MKLLRKLLIPIFILFTCFTFAQNTPVIVFDYGDVICTSSTKEIHQFLQKTFQLEKEEYFQTMKEFRKALINGMSEMEFWLQIAREKNIIIDEKMVRDYQKIQFKGVREVPGMVDLVKTLQKNGYKTALLSNVVERYANIIRKLGYYDLFDPVLLSYEIGVVKPKPKAYEILLETLNAEPHECIFIDDKLENVEGAKAHGIDAIQFTSYDDLIEELQKRDIVL